MKKLMHLPQKAKISLFLLALVATGAFVFLFLQKNPSVLGIKTTSADNKSADPKAELESLLAQIRQIMLLPNNETPTLATVSEIEKIRNQTFFRNAQNGDKVLIYANARKAILYRPENKMIIEVGTVTQNKSPEVASGAEGEQQKLPEVKLDLPKKVLFINGTEESGLSTKLSAQAAAIPGVEVVDRVVAQKTDYEHTLIIDLTGNRATEAQFLAQELQAAVGELPADENRPEGVDFVVLVGADKLGIQ